MDHIFENLSDCHELDAAELEGVLQQLRDAARRDPAAFGEAVRSIPLDSGSRLYWVYAALAPVATEHAGFLVAEVRRLIEALRDRTRGRHLVEAIEGLKGIRDDALQATLCDELVRHATSDSARVRRAVAWLVPDFDPAGRNRQTLQLLAADPDWRVRVLAAYALEEYDGAPLGSTLRWQDALRARLRDVWDW